MSCESNLNFHPVFLYEDVIESGSSDRDILDEWDRAAETAELDRVVVPPKLLPLKEKCRFIRGAKSYRKPPKSNKKDVYFDPVDGVVKPVPIDKSKEVMENYLQIERAYMDTMGIIGEPVVTDISNELIMGNHKRGRRRGTKNKFRKKKVDVLRDIAWVYANISILFVPTDRGTYVIKEDRLAKAPSQGAIAMARYAQQDMKSFLEKFVTKIIPRDDDEKKRASDEEMKKKMEEIDPSMAELEKYVKN